MTQTLQCPHCKGDHLHQAQTQLYCREESKKSVVVIASMYSGMISQDIFDDELSNPSMHRQGMRIIFTCEDCEEYPQLVIFQHKGATYMEWEV